MPTPFCEDFDIQVGKNLVHVVFDFNNHRVCWSSGRDHFCIGLDTLTEMRKFLNERLGESVTTIVNEFQYEFAVRRQRAFWIVESMLDPRWCVVEAVVSDGCVTWGGEYADISEEYRGCFEGVIDIEDFFDAWIDTMRKYAVSILDHCGASPSYLKPTVRRVPFGETECTEIEDYEQWVKRTIKDIAGIEEYG
jgi:hypothetical protein